MIINDITLFLTIKYTLYQLNFLYIGKIYYIDSIDDIITGIEYSL